MKRYFCLWPPAIPREVTCPLLLRPPLLRLPSVSALTGLPFHSADLSTRIRPRRSEEHTSELQSLMRISYAVFCLKKKPNTRKIPHRSSDVRTNFITTSQKGNRPLYVTTTNMGTVPEL